MLYKNDEIIQNLSVPSFRLSGIIIFYNRRFFQNFTCSAFESEWPRMDSSRHLATTKSLNSVGGSSGSIWQNQSESSFSIFEPVSDLSPFCFDANNNNSFDESLSWDEGLTLGRLSHHNREMEDFNPWEESRLPVFRHLSKHDGETV